MSNLLIIGANGGIGRQTVDQALSAGHRVTALVRNPAKLSFSHPHLKIVRAMEANQPLDAESAAREHVARGRRSIEEHVASNTFDPHWFE